MTTSMLLIVFLLCGPKTYGDVLKGVDVVSIYDGDTIVCDIANWPPVVGDRVPIRLYGIDAPELDSKVPEIRDKALAAKQRLVAIIRGPPDHRPTITLHELRRDKYFRLLAVVKADGLDVGAVLLKEGHARPYDGGKKAVSNARLSVADRVKREPAEWWEIAPARTGHVMTPEHPDYYDQSIPAGD